MSATIRKAISLERDLAFLLKKRRLINKKIIATEKQIIQHNNEMGNIQWKKKPKKP